MRVWLIDSVFGLQKLKGICTGLFGALAASWSHELSWDSTCHNHRQWRGRIGNVHAGGQLSTPGGYNHCFLIYLAISFGRD